MSDKKQIWQALARHHAELKHSNLQEQFAGQPQRAKRFSIRFNSLLADYSKQLVTDETLKLLYALADAAGISAARAELFSGGRINQTENRPALHSALRLPPKASLLLEGENICAQVQQELTRMELLVEALHRGEITGASGRPINKVVNIGIGGSDLGPRLAVEALRDFRLTEIEIAFVTNLDEGELHRVLEGCDPETTLFIVTSKSFTTLETGANAERVRRWLLGHNCPEPGRHFIAVTGNQAAAASFGITPERIFHLPEWVGGRYSIWSAVGLPVAISVGMHHFREMLAGAHAMDIHFQEAPMERNIPVTLALLGIWYNNLFDAQTLAVVPYDQRLQLLPDYLSQLIMESNGKGVDGKGRPLEHHSSPVVWGATGTNAQHAFFQQLHQGTRLIPVEFLLCMRGATGSSEQHKLVANGIAQSKALMLGEPNREQPHKHFPGNRPSTTIAYGELSPHTFGMLLAMYELRTFVQATIWDINPFDQWGVELGKRLAGDIIADLENRRVTSDHDASTRLLMDFFLENN